MSSNPSGGVASYKLEIKPSAAKELESLGTKKDCEKIVARINALASDPRPSGSEKLAGRQNSYRIRQGNYRWNTSDIRVEKVQAESLQHKPNFLDSGDPEATILSFSTAVLVGGRRNDSTGPPPAL